MSYKNPLPFPSSEGPRSETIVTRMTPHEMAAIEADAEASGQSRSAWLRDAALTHLARPERRTHGTADVVILAEIMGLRSLILNLFTHVPGIAAETVRGIMRYADSIKSGDAERTLTRAREDGTPVATRTDQCES